MWENGWDNHWVKLKFKKNNGFNGQWMHIVGKWYGGFKTPFFYHAKF
jgi:hypothetical protein